MNPIANLGLRRIVVIESKQIAYADIEFGCSTQLVGENGRGKTTLINALQFLYVPDERTWFFGKHDRRETKDFYFPSDRVDYSRILFEVMTPTGLAVVGVKRLTALGYDLLHFIYRGAFEIEDHVKPDRSVLKWDEVEGRLSQKRFLKISNLQESLTNVVGDTALGLVPLKRAATTESHLFEKKFVPAFQRMLRLQSLSQADMQQMLIDHGQINDAQREFNPRDQWNDQIERLMSTFEEAKQLSDAAPQVSRAVEQYERLNDDENWLWSAHKVIIENKQAAAENFRFQIEELGKKSKPLREAFDALNVQISEAQTKLVQSEKETFHLGKDIKRINLKTAEYEAAGYDVSIEEAAIAALSSDCEWLARRLTVGQLKSVLELKTDLAAKTKEVESLAAKIARFSNLLVTHLRENMEEQEIAHAFSVIDPKLLSLIEGDECVVQDVPELVARLKMIAARFSKGRYSDNTVSFSPASDAQHELSKFASTASLETSLEAAKRIQGEIQQQLADAEAAEEIRSRIAALRQAIIEKNTALTLYRQHQEQVNEIPSLRSKITQHESDEADLKKKIISLEAKNEALKAQLAAIQKDIAEIQSKQEQMSNLVATLRPPTPPMDTPSQASQVLFKMEDFNGFVGEYVRRREIADHDRQSWDNTTRAMEVVLRDRFSSGDPSPRKRLKNLLVEIDALENQKKTIESTFKSFVASLSHSFRSLLEGLKRVDEAARDITREFTGLHVSNMEYIKCKAEPVAAEVRVIEETAALRADMDLFSDPDAGRKLVEKIRQRWQSHPTYELTDLFRVSLVVKKPGHGPVTMTHFDSDAGSNGQVTTLKVLINLILIGTYLSPKREARLPFYLDEVGAIDSTNLSLIQKFALERGFTALYAAPTPSVGIEPSFGIERYYSLSDGGPRVVVRREHMQIITPKYKPTENFTS